VDFMGKNVFEKIFELATPYLKEGKPEDFIHASSVKASVELFADNASQLDILIPFAILHDAGNSVVLPEDFHYIQGKTIVENGKLFHGLAGAKIAYKILTSVDYNKDQIRAIVDLIKIHDFDDLELFKTRSWQIARDADILDRMNVERLKGMMKTRNLTAIQILDLVKTQVPCFFSEKARDEFNKRQQVLFDELKIDKKYWITPKMVE